MKRVQRRAFQIEFSETHFSTRNVILQSKQHDQDGKRILVLLCTKVGRDN